MLLKERHLSGFASGIHMQDRIANRGLPQGSILSPLLFNLYVTLIERCLPLPVQILMYADDIAIYCSHESIVYIKNQLNLALENLSLFLKDLNLAISPSKSSFTIFSNMSSRNLNSTLRFNNIRIQLDGVQVFPNLSFLGHPT